MIGRWTRRLLRAAPFLASCTACVWALSTNPLAAPFVERSAHDLALTLERQVRRRATTDRIVADLSDAVATDDVDRAAMLIGLARDLDRPVDATAAEVMIARHSGALATALECGACMADVSVCATLAHVAACAVPFELSPLGDVNALRRAGVAWTAGEDVDRLDASLAVVGLAATGAILVSGGSSASVKAGAGLLRTVRRMGSITPELGRALRLPIRWERVPAWLRGAAPLDDVTDATRARALMALAADMGRVRAATSTAEALRLARLVDTPADAARLARVAEAAGPRTTRSLHVLGKSRAFRLTLRLSRAALGTLALLWLTLAQAAAIIGSRVGGAIARAATPPPPPSTVARPRTPPLGAARVRGAAR